VKWVLGILAIAIAIYCVILFFRRDKRSAGPDSIEDDDDAQCLSEVQQLVRDIERQQKELLN